MYPLEYTALNGDVDFVIGGIQRRVDCRGVACGSGRYITLCEIEGTVLEKEVYDDLARITAVVTDRNRAKSLFRNVIRLGNTKGNVLEGHVEGLLIRGIRLNRHNMTVRIGTLTCQKRTVLDHNVGCEAALCLGKTVGTNLKNGVVLAMKRKAAKIQHNGTVEHARGREPLKTVNLAPHTNVYGGAGMTVKIGLCRILSRLQAIREAQERTVNVNHEGIALRIVVIIIRNQGISALCRLDGQDVAIARLLYKVHCSAIGVYSGSRRCSGGDVILKILSVGVFDEINTITAVNVGQRNTACRSIQCSALNYNGNVYLCRTTVRGIYQCDRGRNSRTLTSRKIKATVTKRQC